MNQLQPKNLTRYCRGCKKRHGMIVDAWNSWNHKIINGKEVYWCKKHFFCVGCNAVHQVTSYSRHCKRIHPKTGIELDGWWCEKWVNTPVLTPEQKMANMSPQEVVSGVHLGAERQEVWGKDTEDFGTIRAQQLPELEEALSE